MSTITVGLASPPPPPRSACTRYNTSRPLTGIAQTHTRHTRFTAKSPKVLFVCVCRVGVRSAEYIVFFDWDGGT